MSNLYSRLNLIKLNITKLLLKTKIDEHEKDQNNPPVCQLNCTLNDFKNRPGILQIKPFFHGMRFGNLKKYNSEPTIRVRLSTCQVYYNYMYSSTHRKWI